ncbi:MAG: hypothetical protein ACRERC_09815 [Candidatus Binatia bacterium]
MPRLRTPLAALAPAVAALFALSVAAPRSGWVHHHHAGGERTHVHAEDDDLADLLGEILAHRHAHDDGVAHDHHRRHRRAPSAAQRSATPHGTQLSGDAGGDAGHWHQRQLFQRAVVPDVVYVTAVATVGTAPPTAPPRIDRVAVHASHARAPPAPLFSDC